VLGVCSGVPYWVAEVEATENGYFVHIRLVC
jgi:hypothetical protein